MQSGGHKAQDRGGEHDEQSGHNLVESLEMNSFKPAGSIQQSDRECVVC